METQNKTELTEEVMALKDLVFGKITGVNHTFRFSGERKIRNQSVAEHSYWTALIAGALAKFENSSRKKYGVPVAPIDLAKIYEFSLLHDVDEVITGDLNHRFKHSINGQAFREELSDLIHTVAPRALFSKIISGTEFQRSWEESHIGIDLSYEVYLLKMGDWLQLLQYSVEEVQLGNATFHSKIQRAIKLIKENNSYWERYSIYNDPVNGIFFVPTLVTKLIEHLEEQLQTYNTQLARI